jgi:ATP-dependent Zn protease
MKILIVGVGASRIREIFGTAKKSAPCKVKLSLCLTN